MTSNSKFYDGLDVLKFILCIMIVAVHAEFLWEYEIIKTIVTHFNRVSIFFAISTFLFFSIAKNDIKKRLFHFLKRIIILYIVWEIIYFPYTWNQFYSFASAKEIIFAILFTGTYGISWFLKALMWGTIILTIIPRKYTLIATILFSLISIFPIYENLPIQVSNWYYFFIPHLWSMAVGKLIAENKKHFIFNQDKFIYILGFLCIYLMSFIPIPKMTLFCRLFYPFLLIPLFMHLHFINVEASKTLRKMSVIIYLVHMLLIYVLKEKVTLISTNIYI